jgi:hypothetical protein
MYAEIQSIAAAHLAPCYVLPGRAVPLNRAAQATNPDVRGKMGPQGTNTEDTGKRATWDSVFVVQDKQQTLRTRGKGATWDSVFVVQDKQQTLRTRGKGATWDSVFVVQDSSRCALKFLKIKYEGVAP